MTNSNTCDDRICECGHFVFKHPIKGFAAVDAVTYPCILCDCKNFKQKEQKLREKTWAETVDEMPRAPIVIVPEKCKDWLDERIQPYIQTLISLQGELEFLAESIRCREELVIARLRESRRQFERDLTTQMDAELKAERDALRKRLDGLVEALKHYARHEASCFLNYREGKPCNCGLQAALDTAQDTPTPAPTSLHAPTCRVERDPTATTKECDCR